MKSLFAVTLLLSATSMFVLAGCGSGSGDADQNQPSADAAKTAAGDHEEHMSGHMSEEAKANLAKLSPEDAAAAKEQKVCPVSGEMLGAMGTPKKVEVQGKEVFICCDACKDPLLESPDKYLAKLEQN